MNPTAAHYFYQIVNNLINKNQLTLLSYIYSHKQILKSLVSKLEISAYKQLLSRIVMFYKDDEKNDISFKFLKYRFTLIKRLFQTLFDDSSNSPTTMDKDSLQNKERNAIELLLEIVANRERIVDSDYFIDRILLDKKGLKKLLLLLKTKRSTEVLKLLSPLLEGLFGLSDKPQVNKNESNHDESKNLDKLKIEMEDDDIVLEMPEYSKKKLPKQLEFSLKDIQKEMNDKIVPRDSFGVPLQNFHENDFEPDDELREHKKISMVITPEDIKQNYSYTCDFEIDDIDTGKDFQSTAETSNGPVHNIELELYDDSEIKKSKIASYIKTAIEVLFRDLFDEKSFSMRSIATTNISESRPSGVYKIGVIKFLSNLSRMMILEERVKSSLTPEIIEKLMGQFVKNPMNNLLHFELTRFLETLIAMTPNLDSWSVRKSIYEVLINKVHEYHLLFQKTGSKKASETYLFKSHLIQLCGILKPLIEAQHLKNEENGKKIEDILGFLKSESETLDNKLFKYKRKGFEFSTDNLPDHFELSDTKINEIISRKNKHMNQDDELIEIHEDDYSSNHPDLNTELLNNLILNLKNDTDYREEEESVNEAIMEYEVRMDLEDMASDDNKRSHISDKKSQKESIRKNQIKEIKSEILEESEICQVSDLD